MEREIILDTETTGLDPKNGDRVIEIGCVEIINRLPTGRTFHKYLNPEDKMVDPAAFNVHGISNEFLKDKPKFTEVVDEFLEFIGDSKLVIHNAEFDVKFLNAELFHAKKPELKKDRVFCTLIFARKKFPGQQNSLDALCRRFSVDFSHRTKHGALLDSEILAEVYMELMGGRQNAISLEVKKVEKAVEVVETVQKVVDFEYRKFEISEEEEAAHKKFVEGFKGALWGKVAEEA